MLGELGQKAKPSPCLGFPSVREVQPIHKPGKVRAGLPPDGWDPSPSRVSCPSTTVLWVPSSLSNTREPSVRGAPGDEGACLRSPREADWNLGLVRQREQGG